MPVSILISMMNMNLPKMLAHAAQPLSVRSHGGGWVGSWQGGTRLRCSCDNSSLPRVTEIRMLLECLELALGEVLFYRPVLSKACDELAQKDFSNARHRSIES